MASILVIGPDTYNTQSLVRAAQERGLCAQWCSISAIPCVVDVCDDSAFFRHDIYIFRGYNRSVAFAQSLAQYLRARGKVVIDGVLGTSYITTKFYEALQYHLHDIPHPRTVYARDVAQWEQVIRELPLPIIVKPEDAQKGRGVQKYDTYSDALAFFAEHPKGFLAQEYVPLTYDIRAVVVDGVAIGAMRRYAPTGDFRTNVSLGSSMEVHELSDEERTLALRACAVFGYDVAGVDLITRGDETLVLEVNIAPQWEGFEQTTGISVADAIIEMALRRLHDGGERQ